MKCDNCKKKEVELCECCGEPIKNAPHSEIRMSPPSKHPFDDFRETYGRSPDKWDIIRMI